MTYHGSNLLFLSAFMYLFSSLAYSRSHPFRTRIFKNKLFFTCQTLLLACNLVLLFSPPRFLVDLIEFRVIPDLSYKMVVCGIALFYLAVVVAFEVFVVEEPRVWNYLRPNTSKQKKFKSVLIGLKSSDLHPDWLIGKNVYADDVDGFCEV